MILGQAADNPSPGRPFFRCKVLKPPRQIIPPQERIVTHPPIDVVAGVIRRGVSTWARLFSFGAWRVGAAQNGKVALTVGELDAVSLPLRLWMVGVIEQTTRRAVRADLRVTIVEGDHDFVPEMICEIG